MNRDLKQPASKSLTSKFTDVVNKIQRTGISFRDTDPSIVIANFKSEIDLTE